MLGRHVTDRKAEDGGQAEQARKLPWHKPKAEMAPVRGVTAHSPNVGIDGDACATSTKLAS